METNNHHVGEFAMVDEDREMRVSLLDKGDNFQIELLNPNSGKKEKCLLNNASRSGMTG